MRRKGKPERHALRVVDVRKELDANQLALIGAVSLAWNEIEVAIDAVMCLAIKAPPALWLEISSRINGFDGKMAIIRSALRQSVKMPEADYDPINETLAAIEQHKRFRDGVIHARIHDPADAIAETAQRKGIVDEVLVSTDALEALYSFLIALRTELDAILSILFSCCVYPQASPYLYLSMPDSGGPSGQQVVQAFRAVFARLQEHQNHRLSLPPLPKFPDERRDR